MKTIAIEEHFAMPFGPHERTDTPTSGGTGAYMAEVGERLVDLGAGRLADMDAAQIDMQVLSLSAVDEGLRSDAAEIARSSNDLLAETVRRAPTRFAGFGTLPMTHPEKAAAELERCVTKLKLVGAVIDGTTEGKFLDDPRFEPVLAEAERLDVPIYLHPAPPPKAVFDAYYSGLPAEAAAILSISGWGWHAETALHSFRLIVAGAFDRFPKLKMIIGHMGEFIPYCFNRSDLLLSRAAPHLQRRVGEYFQTNFYITTSGYFTTPPFLCALSVVGADHILFAVDYPYSPNAAGRSFLQAAPVGALDMEKITHGNAERLLKLRP